MLRGAVDAAQQGGHACANVEARKTNREMKKTKKQNNNPEAEKNWRSIFRGGGRQCERGDRKRGVEQNDV